MEFENLQIEVPTEDDDTDKQENTLNPAWEKTYHNASKGFVVGLDLTSNEAVKRKENRAKRFGVETTHVESSEHNNPFLEVDLVNIGFPKVTDAAFADQRLDSLHLHGVSNMNTKDVFEYFKGHGPDTLEWIDDHSCNVVWETESMAKIALMQMSRTYNELKQMTKGVRNEDFAFTPSEKAERIWRIAKPHKKARYLFLRHATKEDKKLPGAAQRSLYYLIHGNGQGTRGGIVSSSRKRRMEQANTFLQEKLQSKNPEVQFFSVNDSKKLQSDLDDMEVEIDNTCVPSKKSKGYDIEGKMYSDQPSNQGTFSKAKKEENLRIEVSNFSSKWTSNKKNQHRRDGSGSSSESSDNSDDDDDEEDSDDDSDDDSSLDEEMGEKLDDRKLLITFDQKRGAHYNDSEDDEMDLRDQIKSSDLRSKIKSSDSEKGRRTDLRTKLEGKKKHLGLNKEQLNLCIEVTEVSDED